MDHSAYKIGMILASIMISIITGGTGCYTSSMISKVSNREIVGKSQRSLQLESVEKPDNLSGFIKSIDQKGKDNFITFDMAQFIGGEKAKQAAFDDGVCADITYCAPNNFYIRNNSTSTQSFKLSSQASIRVYTIGPGQIFHNPDGTWRLQKISVPEFMSATRKLTTPDYQGDVRNLPYNLTLKDNEVITIEEQFIP